MPQSRLLAPALALSLLAAPAVAVAQGDATPETTSRAQSASVAADPVVGAAVPYLSETGEAIGTVSVLAVTDPFDDFRESFQVEEGSRYVAFEVVVAAEDLPIGVEEPLQARTSDFGLQTVDGFFYNATSAPRDLSSSDVPDLPTIVVDPDTEVSGLVFFQIPADAELARLFYSPATGRLILAADLRADT